MGLDGGTKITRSDVLRGQSWRLSQADGSRSTRGGSVNQVWKEPELKEPDRRALVWSTCALSGEPLTEPIVSDELGQLMNREAVVEHVLAARGGCVDEAARLRYANLQRASAGAFDHIRSTKDVFSVVLHAQREAGGPAAAAAAAAAASAQPACPVTALPCAGGQPFSALRPCGHVLSDKALAAIRGDAACCCCPVCDARYDPASDVVRVNGSKEEIDATRQRLLLERAAREAKRARKRARGEDAAQPPRLEGGSGEPPPPPALPAEAATAALPAERLRSALPPAGGEQQQEQQQQQHKAARVELGETRR